jgi:4-hydroxy-tetrahydrodipicolinate synthase
MSFSANGSANGKEFHGVFAAALTPFHEDESLDEGAFEAHLDYLISSGIEGLLVIGGSGEYVNLSSEERKKIVSLAVQSIGGRVPVLVGLLSPSTREAVEIGTHAAQEGADALLVLPPYYIRPSLDGIVYHFETIARETGLKIVAYNIPGRTGYNLDVDALGAIATVPAVVAVKDCDRDLAMISARVRELGDRLSILSGDDDLGFPTLLVGAHGAIWAGANFAPKMYVELFRASVNGDIDRGLELHHRLLPMVETWLIRNHPAPLKELMGIVGRPVGPARQPLRAMTAEERSKLELVLSKFGPYE